MSTSPPASESIQPVIIGAGPAGLTASYQLLKRGVTTELVRFPAPESHELSRSGTPKHRRERFDIILEWHRRFLT